MGKVIKERIVIDVIYDEETFGDNKPKAKYQKHFSAKRKLEELFRNSYCGNVYRQQYGILSHLGLSDYECYLLIGTNPSDVWIEYICDRHGLDSKQVKIWLRR